MLSSSGRFSRIQSICPVELARSVALQHGREILGRVEPDLVEPRVLRVPVVLVADRLDVRLHDPVVEPKRSVADELAGPRELDAMLLEARAVHRVRRAVREQAEKVRRRVLELDLERVIVERAHTELGRRELARRDLVGVHDRAQDERVTRQRRGVDAAPEAEDVVIRGDLVAVRPARVAAQSEHVGLAVRAHGPRLGAARHGIALRRFVDQPFEQVAQNVRAGHFLVAMRVERLNLRAVTEVQYLHFRKLGAARAADRSAAGAAAVDPASARGEHEARGGDRRPLTHSFHSEDTPQRCFGN
jgi:hypothetical protein